MIRYKDRLDKDTEYTGLQIFSYFKKINHPPSDEKIGKGTVFYSQHKRAIASA